MLTIALIHPKIPPNTGNIARLCATTKTRLHIVGDIGFSLDAKQVRRAGLDYWHLLDWTYFESADDYMAALDPPQMHLLTTKTETPYWDRQFGASDTLIFGSETEGLPETYLDRWADRCSTIPMAEKAAGARSLNLSNSAGIVLYEAIRQLQI